MVITGNNFTGTLLVTFGGTPATGVTVLDDSTISAIAPAHVAGTVDIAVTTLLGSGTGTNLYTYVTLSPVVTGVALTAAPRSAGPR